MTEQTKLKQKEKKQLTIEEVIEKGKELLLQLHLNTFHRYREIGKLVIESGYRKGAWHSKNRKEALDEWAISQGTFSRMVQLGELTEIEFNHVVINFPSVHAWINQIEKEPEKPYEPLPEGIYDVIYADPPWSFFNWTSFSPTKHYPTLSTEKIAELKELLNDKVGKNAVLFLWTPNGILEEALEVMEAWGFEYKTNIVWVKDKPLMGYYTKSQHELLLIGVKGNIGTPTEQDKPPSTILFTKANRRHSEKPEEVYNIIETMYPSHKYLELFARNKRENWKSWGNEVEN